MPNIEMDVKLETFQDNGKWSGCITIYPPGIEPQTMRADGFETEDDAVRAMKDKVDEFLGLLNQIDIKVVGKREFKTIDDEEVEIQ